MKKILLTAAAAAILSNSLFAAANLQLQTHSGQSVATFTNGIKKVDGTDIVDDDSANGIHFFDGYNNEVTDNMVYFSSGEAPSGGEISMKWSRNSWYMNLFNGWVSFGDLRVTAGRFNAYPRVDFVKDATSGYHYNSYAAQYQPGFDPQVMSWFLRNQGFVRGAHDVYTTTSFSYTPVGKSTAVTADYINVTTTDYAGANLTLEGYNWYFYDGSNAGSCIDYTTDTTNNHGNRGGLMLTYNLGENAQFRAVATFGSAWANGGAIVNNYLGEKTLTNLNFQASYQVPEIVKLGLTFKISDLISGINDDLSSAGSDMSVRLDASTDTLVEGLQLYAGYTFAAAMLGMYGDVGKDEDLSESYFFNTADLRAVYQLNEQIKIGLNSNLSIVSQSEYVDKASDGEAKDYVGFNVGLSASYQWSELIAFDITTGFRCLNLNHENAKGDTDPMAVSSFGIEPGIAFTMTKTSALNIGINFLLQNLSGEDDKYAATTIWLNNNKASAAANTVYPLTMVISVPVYLRVQL